MEEIKSLKKENEKLKKKAKDGDQDKKRKEVDLFNFNYKKDMRRSPNLRRNFIKTIETSMKKSYP